MPKKWAGENSKSAVAKARKADAQSEENAQRQKAKDDAYWEDNDKHLAKKQQRQADKNKKKQDSIDKRAESRALADEEDKQMEKLSAKTPGPSKVTRHQLDMMKESQAKQGTKPKKSVENEMPLHENINQVIRDSGLGPGDAARSVEEAISVLSVKEPELDKHPERRMKAAYTAFEERRLAELKIEFPNLRMSQLKQKLKKEWLKSTENPMNQVHSAYNN